jgi:hypothetical protein
MELAVPVPFMKFSVPDAVELPGLLPVQVFVNTN